MGRGDVLDEKALIDHLNNNKIAGAALDTFQKEPLPKESPLWEMENVIITPHIGGNSDIYPQQALVVFQRNLELFLDGDYLDMVNLVPSQ